MTVGSRFAYIFRLRWRRCLAALVIYVVTALIGALIFYGVEGGNELALAQAYKAEQDAQALRLRP